MIQEWCKASVRTDMTFYVLRDKNKLQKIEQFLNGSETSLNDIEENCLIAVSIVMDSRGNAGKFSIVCLPKNQDFHRNNINRKVFLNRPVHIEPLAIDENQARRKLLRSNHLRMIKRLRRQRIRAKRYKQAYLDRKVIITPPRTSNLTRLQFSSMCDLWLPSAPKTIRYQCSREVFGYLTQCQYLYHEAKVCGLGYVTVNGIRELAKLKGSRKSNEVLVRDSNSLNYCLAILSIRYI